MSEANRFGLHRLVVVLTLVNLTLSAAIAAQIWAPRTHGAERVVRAEGLEIVDERGTIRARISIEAAATPPDGRRYPEAVVFRMTDPQGRIRVKLAADQDGSGLLLSNGSQQPGVHMLAGPAGSTVKVINQDGRQQVVKP